ncbi:hypothetical protein VKT23_013079 [Stygiomarasmius scandens]|uniref:Uncharacterized protein n=1 Tax=Marasmiellus scandens TaxID=2682957 RepID=A0ABR1J8D7_9AGAR
MLSAFIILAFAQQALAVSFLVSISTAGVQCGPGTTITCNPSPGNSCKGNFNPGQRCIKVTQAQSNCHISLYEQLNQQSIVDRVSTDKVLSTADIELGMTHLLG